MTRLKKIFYTALAALLTWPVAAAGDVNVDLSGKSAVPIPKESTFKGFGGATTLGEVVVAIIQIFLYIVGSISILFIIIGGFRYLTAHGNEEQAEAAKKTITHAVIGFVAVILSFAILTILANILVLGKL